MLIQQCPYTTINAYTTMVRFKLNPIKSRKFEFRNLDHIIRFGLKNDSENPKNECRLYNFLMDCKRSNNLPDQTLKLRLRHGRGHELDGF